jgi:hypothetical protein
MSANEIDLTNLKRAVVMRLDGEAKEHSKGHQKNYANRYSMRSSDGALVELMFEKGEKSPANLWVKQQFAMDLLDGRIPVTLSPAANLYQTVGKTGEKQYGRHSALEDMMQLGKADLACFALRSMADLNQVLEMLTRVTRPVRA